MSDGRRSRPGALVVGTAEQVVDEVAAQPQLSLGQRTLMGQFHGQHDRAVLQREDVLLPRLLAGIDHTEHAQYLVARLGDRHDPIAVPHGPPAAADPGQQLGPIPRLRARVGARATRAGPGEQVAEAVLDRDGQPGEVVHRVGYPGRAASVGRHPGEDLVDPLALLQVRHGARELLVGRLEPCVEVTQLHGAGPLPAVQARADQGRPGQLGQRRQQEPLVDRRLVVGRDDEVAGVPADRPHRKGPGPLGSGHLDGAVRPVELDQLGDDARSSPSELCIPASSTRYEPCAW